MGSEEMKNKIAAIRNAGTHGMGLFASRDIEKDEIVADFSDGKVYETDKASDLPKEVADHAIQFEEHKWIDTSGTGRYLNHSCNPNCGIKDKFKIVAMRDIKKDEELTFDYEMAEDSDWRMKCDCGLEGCRKIIGTYGNLPQSVKEKYKEYTSEWLIDKYGE